MENELKPCPFCGGKNTESNIIEHEDDCYIIKALYAITGKSDFSQIEAIKAWNTRYERTCTMEQSLRTLSMFVCSLCHGKFALSVDDKSGLYHCPNCGAKVVSE